MSSDKKPPIIKKIIKKGHGAHHSTSWKVALADFMTALMAFFLLMWLLAISSEQGREALADYFNELTLTDAIFNGGLPSAFTEGGARRPSILDGGCLRPRSEGDSTIDPEAENEAVQAQIMALLETSQQLLQTLESLPEGVEGGEGSGDAGRSDVAPGDPRSGGDAGGGPLTAEEENFRAELMRNVEGSLGDAASGQMEVERIRGGLRIQIMDQDGRPLFSLGGAGLTGHGRQLLEVVAQRLATVPNKIAIEGHTDGLRMAGQKVTNWELSTARASAARIILTQAGVADNRLTAVTGYADTQPLPGIDPNDPQNRRISIMIWDEEPPAAPPPSARPALPGAADTPPAEGGVSGPGAGPAPLDRPTTKPAPPSLPRPSARPPVGPPAKTREQLESELIESSMQRAATDRSTVGPPLPPQPPEENWR